MPSTAIDSQIHGFLFSTDEMREIFSDRSWAQKWLDTEAALAAAQAELGIIPQEKADIIVKHADADLLDIPSIGEFYKSSITIVPLLKAFKAVLPDNAGEFVHWGATSQDIVDTGLVLLQRDGIRAISTGVHPVGTLLPSEQELMKIEGVSRHTVRAALKILEQYGLIKRTLHVGTTVISRGALLSFNRQLSTLSDLDRLAERNPRKLLDIR